MVQREWSKDKCLENSLCYVHLEDVMEIFRTSENLQRHNRDEVVDQVLGCHPGWQTDLEWAHYQPVQGGQKHPDAMQESCWSYLGVHPKDHEMDLHSRC